MNLVIAVPHDAVMTQTAIRYGPLADLGSLPQRSIASWQQVLLSDLVAVGPKKLHLLDAHRIAASFLCLRG
jgi:hypothetical protein